MVSPARPSVRKVLLSTVAALATFFSVGPHPSHAATLTFSGAGSVTQESNSLVITGPVLSNPTIYPGLDPIVGTLPYSIYQIYDLTAQVLDQLTPGSGNGTVPYWTGSADVGPALRDANLVTYPLPSAGQVAQIGAPTKFSKFGPATSIILNWGTGPFVVYLGSNRPVATPPAALATFPTDNEAPNALLTLPSGATFGTTAGGGAHGAGQLLQIGIDGSTPSITPRIDFDSATTGATPSGTLRAGPNGALYGLTRAGGAHGKGSIFRFDPATGAFEVVTSFPADLVGVANSLVIAPGGTIYGTSSVLAEKGEIRRPLPPAYNGPIFLYNAPASTPPTNLLTGDARFTLSSGLAPTGGMLALNSPAAPGSLVEVSGAASDWVSGITFSSQRFTLTSSQFVYSPTTIYPDQLGVGAGFLDHGSVFRVSNSGQFEVLKTFHEGEVAQTDVFAGPGFLAGTFARISPGAQTISYNPPIELTGPGTYRAIAGRWQYTPDDSSLPMQEGTLPETATLSGTSKTFFPSNLGLTPDGHLLCSVSGGLYQLATDGSGGQWVLDPAIVDIGPPIAYLNALLIYSPITNYPPPGTRVFGTYIYTSPTVRELVLREATPAMETLPNGNLFVVAGNSEWEITPTGYVDRTVAVSRGVIGENFIFGPWISRRLSGPAFPYADQRYRFESSSDTSMNLTALDGGRARPLADFSLLRTGTLLPLEGSERDLLVVGRRRGETNGWELLRVARTANQPPEISSASISGAAGTLSNDNPPVRTIEVAPLSNFQAFGPPTDANDDSLSLASVGTPSYGSAEILPGNILRYTGVEPLALTTFDFTITDAHGGNTTRTLTIGPGAPLALDDEAVLVGYDTAFLPVYRVTPLANDTDQQNLPLAALLAIPPSVGQVKADGDGFLIKFKTLSHPPLTYLVTNGQRLSTARITFPNRPPAGPPDRTFVVNERGVVKISYNDLAYDPDGDEITFALSTPPSKGVITEQNGSLLYQAVSALADGDQFALTVQDSYGANLVITVTIVAPETSFSGTLSGVIQKDGAPLGLLRLTATGSGKASALLTLGTRQYRGSVRPVGDSFTATLVGPNGSKFIVSFTRTSSGVTASVRIAGAEYSFALTGEDLDSLGNLVGSYHLTLTGDALLPARHGFAILTQTANGQVKVVGRTPHGSPWSAAGLFDLAGNFSFIAPIGTGGRTIGGTLHRTITNNETSLSGTLVWQSAGGDRELSVEGGRYDNPADLGVPFLGRTGPVAYVEVSPAGKPGLLGYFDVDESGKATIADPVSRPTIQIRFIPATGLFRGSAKVGGKMVPFTGMLRADGISGVGMLLGPAGSVEVTTP